MAALIATKGPNAGQRFALDENGTLIGRQPDVAVYLDSLSVSRHHARIFGQHGQVGLVKQLAQELGPFGITVNSVAPGFMATSPDYERQWNSYSEEFRRAFADRIAMRRMGRPEDIADAVLFLASDRASWITGQILPVTGSPLA